MEEINATFEIVTPTFLGGAEPTARPELRAPSIKGALRWWWRALTAERDPKTLRRREAELFGSTDTGQASFLLSAKWVREPASDAAGAVSNVLRGGQQAGARYLGYGLVNAVPRGGRQAGELDRACYQPDGRFSLRLVSRTAIDPSIVRALKLFGLLGGLGGRSRRAYGSVAIREADGLRESWSPPATVAEYGDALRRLLGDLPTGIPDHSAFSAASRVLHLATERDPITAMSLAGRALQEHRRSVNKDGSPRDSDARAVAGAVLGLPHVYGRYQVRPAGRDLDRRASPLLLHVHPLKEGSALIATMLPARFLPDDRVMIGKGGQEYPVRPDWRVLEGFARARAADNRGGRGRPFFPEQRTIVGRPLDA